MNKLTGHIRSIKTHGKLSVVEVSCGEHSLLKAMVLETPESCDWLRQNAVINLLFKESEVILLSTPNLELSSGNTLQGTVNAIEKGDLLSRVRLDIESGSIYAMIPTEAISRMSITQGKPGYAMVNQTEIILAKP